jgi:arsenate reductase
MVTQIFGTLKCKDTQKALRFFKERRIPIQYVDLREKSISPGELASITRYLPPEELIDRNGKEYERLNLKYIRHDPEEMLLEYPLLFKTPILRSDFGISVGLKPEIWKDWAKKLKS